MHGTNPLTSCSSDIDQDPRKVHFFEMYQGIANLAGASHSPFDVDVTEFCCLHQRMARLMAGS